MSRVDVRAIRRNQILDAAEQIVAEQGWTQTTFADLCRQADVSNGVLTYHFRGKDEILFALFQRMVGKYRARYIPDLEGAEPLEERIARALREVVFQHSDQPCNRLSSLLMVHMLSEAAHRPAIAEQLRAEFAKTRARLANQVQAEVERGAVRALEPDTTAALIQAFVVGLTLARVALGPEPFTGDLCAAASQMLHRYLTSDATPPPGRGPCTSAPVAATEPQQEPSPT